jgi:hypothetical protein
MIKTYKPTLFLFFLFSLSGFSQSITDDLFLKQDVYIRDLLTAKDYDLKGNPKKVITTAYQFDEKNGSKSKTGYCSARYFSPQGLLIKEGSCKTNDRRDKSIRIYYYTGIRLDSVSDFRKRVYHYDNKGRLKKIFFYDSEGENIDEEEYFYDVNNLINKVVQKSNKLKTIYNYNKNGNITLMTSINSDNHNGTQNEYLYDAFGDLSTSISNDKANNIFMKTNYKRQKDKNNNLIVTEITVHSNKSKTINYKSSYIYDSQGSLINLTSFKNNKKTDVYESKIVYYTTDEINQKFASDTIKEKPINSLEEILKQQLKAGRYNGGDEFESYRYSEKDLLASLKRISDILKSHGYKNIPIKEFNEKIKKVFGRIIDNNSSSKFLSVDFFEKCNKDLVFSRLNIYQNTFIIKNDCFITDLYAIPELIDYKKEYPDLKHVEDQKIYRNEPDLGQQIEIPHWKDISDLEQERKNNIQTLVARNMYLFNDNRDYFKWLLLNDEDFMEKLVTTFGYYDDKELLKWVVGNTKFDKDNPQDLDKLFWNKKCSRTVKLNLEIFPVLKEVIKPNGIDYFEPLKEYVMYLLINKEIRKELPLQDRAKLLAHLVYFGEQYRYDKNYNNQSFFMQRIELFDLDGSLKKEIENNNFYNLLDYKNLYEKSKEYQGQLTDENGG